VKYLEFFFLCVQFDSSPLIGFGGAQSVANFPLFGLINFANRRRRRRGRRCICSTSSRGRRERLDIIGRLWHGSIQVGTRYVGVELRYRHRHRYREGHGYARRLNGDVGGAGRDFAPWLQKKVVVFTLEIVGDEYLELLLHVLLSALVAAAKVFDESGAIDGRAVANKRLVKRSNLQESTYSVESWRDQFLRTRRVDPDGVQFAHVVIEEIFSPLSFRHMRRGALGLSGGRIGER